MKTISIIFILFYLTVPALCFCHPCEIISTSSPLTAASDPADRCPLSHDSDDCETTCCCAGHDLMPISTAHQHRPDISKLPTHDPMIFFPQLITAIIVLPQNIS